MDKVTIKSLKYRARHGWYEHEREEGNQFELDLTAWGDFKEAINNDNLDLTFDYEKAQAIAADVFYGKQERQIETLCSRIGEHIFRDFGHIKKLEVALRKLEPKIGTQSAYAEITMVWTR